jgi:hypothetical protein
MDEPKLTKTCNTCHQALGIENFSKNNARKDGYENKCRECMKIKQKAQYDKHAEKRRASARNENLTPEQRKRKKEYSKVYHKEHKEELNEYCRQWRKENPDYTAPGVVASREKWLLTRKERYANDPEYRAECLSAAKIRRENMTPEQKENRNDCHNRWRKANIDDVRAYHRQYRRKRYAEDEVFREKANLARTVCRHKKFGKGNSTYVKNEDAKAISTETLMRLHGWQRNRCYVCNKPIEKGATVEHIIPRALGGGSVEQNLALTCESCNYSRQTKLLWVDWKPSEVFALPEHHAYVSPKTVAAKLFLEGIDAEVAGNSVVLHGTRDRVLYVLSSFATSERSGIAQMTNLPLELRTHHPDALIIMDWEWYKRFDNVVNMLKAKLGISDRKFARTLEAMFIDTPQAKEFLNSHHVMGYASATYYVGLVDSAGMLWGCGAFKKGDGEMENNRLAFHGHVPGGMSKIVAFLRKSIGHMPIVSYVDSRYADGSGHESIGFEHRGMTPPGYVWVFPNKVHHYRYLSTEDNAVANLLYYDSNRSLKENILANGVFKLHTPPLHRIALVA